MSEDDTDAEVDVAKDDAGQQRMRPTVLAPHRDTEGAPDRAGALLDPRRRLQFQPFMFKRDFVETFILPNAQWPAGRRVVGHHKHRPLH